MTPTRQHSPKTQGFLRNAPINASLVVTFALSEGPLANVLARRQLS